MGRGGGQNIFVQPSYTLSGNCSELIVSDVFINLINFNFWPFLKIPDPGRIPPSPPLDRPAGL